MTHTYTISNTTANTGTITFNTSSGGAGSASTFGGAGQIYTTTGTGTTNWVTSSSPNDTVLKVTQSPPELELKGRMVINGVDLEERLNTIERVLTIPERDVKLEKKHPKLKKLYDEYIQALGKYRTFDAIKGEE